jgi:hypothetical protein
MLLTTSRQIFSAWKKPFPSSRRMKNSVFHDRLTMMLRPYGLMSTSQRSCQSILAFLSIVADTAMTTKHQMSSKKI